MKKYFTWWRLRYPSWGSGHEEWSTETLFFPFIRIASYNVVFGHSIPYNNAWLLFWCNDSTYSLEWREIKLFSVRSSKSKLLPLPGLDWGGSSSLHFYLRLQRALNKISLRGWQLLTIWEDRVFLIELLFGEFELKVLPRLDILRGNILKED